MNRFRRTVNRTTNMDRQSTPTPPTDQADLTSPSTSPIESWTTHDSNLALLECLSTATPTRPALPQELILQILDHPTRWVHLHSVTHPPLANPEKPILGVGNRLNAVPMLFTRPFSLREVGRLRKIVFSFRSRDQGWSSRPDQGSWSWFDASVAQFPSTHEDARGQVDDDAYAVVWTGSYKWVWEWVEQHGKCLEHQPRYKIQTNKHAEITPEDYVIELTDEHELVQRVQEGDRVILWACACYPGWENRVYHAKISVLGVDTLTMKDG